MKIASALVAVLTLSVGIGVAVAADPPAGKPGIAPAKGSGKVGAGKTGAGKRVVKTGGDSRAWTTMKPLLPAGVTLVGQINVAAVRGTDTFKQLRRLAEKDRDLKEGLELVKSGCQIDLGEAVQDVAFAMPDADVDHILTVVSFKGVAEDELLRCAELVLEKDKGKGKVKLDSKRSGAITEYGRAGEAERVYAAWLAPDVVAFVSDAKDRAKLEKMIGGKNGFAGTALARRGLAAVPAGAVAWAVYLKNEKLDPYEMKLGAVSLMVAGGQLGVELSLVMADADTAKRAVADWTLQRDQLVAGGTGMPPVFGPVLKSVQLFALDDVARITVSLSERDLLSFFTLF